METTSGRGLLHDVLTSRVYDVARETPLEPAARLSRRLGHAVLLKREDLQPVFSYKIRGAHNRIAHLDAAERARGVIAASAGNHAQGVAYSARYLGIRAVIVMPETTPEIKIAAVRELGAEVVLAGDSYAESAVRAETLAAEQGLTLVHPFDDPLVIAGQGTVAVELMNQGPRDLARRRTARDQDQDLDLARGQAVRAGPAPISRLTGRGEHSVDGRCIEAPVAHLGAQFGTGLLGR